MNELENLLTQCDFEKKEKVDYDFQAIEDYIGFPLPLDYKYYLNNYEQFQDFVGEEYLALYKIDELIENNEGYNVKEYYDLNTLIIGSNGGGEFIGINFSNRKNYKLVLAPFIGDFVTDQIEIGSSFSNMLQRLIDGKQWFN
ncbi:MAG: / family protein [Mucilaginibacter sp.]|nr:/ family protein [Mucilaginibacter sp.]